MITSQDWSQALRMAISKYFNNITEPLICLEIGSFEGQGSITIHNNMCKHPESRLYCIDPWDDVYVKGSSNYTDIDNLFINQYEKFINNTRDFYKIIPMRGYSGEVLNNLDIMFDFIFVDGDHSPEGVYMDGLICLKKLKPNGYILFDDYGFVHNGVECREGIDKFLNDFKNEIEVVEINEYCLIKKVT